jgi:hypothetical protein
MLSDPIHNSWESTTSSEEERVNWGAGLYFLICRG